MPGILHDDAPELEEPTNPDIEVPDFETGLALALSMCPEGECVTVHDAECPVTAERPSDCNCDVQKFWPVRA